MHMYENGERCPCCGQLIEGMDTRQLELLSQLCHALRLEPLEKLEIEGLEIQDMDTGAFPPPDAGINPPIKPIFDM